MSQISQELHAIADKIVEGFHQGFEQAVNQLDAQFKTNLKNTQSIKDNVLATLVAQMPKMATDAVEAVAEHKPVVETVIEDAIEAMAESALVPASESEVAPVVDNQPAQ